MMKKIWITTCSILFFASIATGDEIGQALSEIASDEVVQSTRQLIQSGLASRSVIEVTRAMVRNRFMTQQIMKAHQVMMNAHQQELPQGPIISKAFEGMSKNVQADRIINAMEKVLARYVFAHQQALKLKIQRTHLTQMGHIIASGLTAGLDEKGINTITQGLQRRSQGMNADQRDTLALETFKIARDLARLGVSSSQSVEVIRQALLRQFSAEQMHNMRSAFIRDSRVKAPQNLATSYGQAIQQGKSFEDQGDSQMLDGGSSGSTGGSGSNGPGSSGGSGAGGSSGSGGSGHGGKR